MTHSIYQSYNDVIVLYYLEIYLIIFMYNFNDYFRVTIFKIVLLAVTPT